MKRNLITKLAELPTEFAIEKYRLPSDLRSPHWYWVAMLDARVIQSHFSIRANNSMREELRRGAIHMLSDPQWPASNGSENGYSPSEYKTPSPVRDRTAFDMFIEAEAAETTDPRLADYANAYEGLKRILKKKSEENEGEYRQLLKNPIWRIYRELGLVVDPTDVVVHVNLCGSEEKIIEDFRVWLRNAQNELSVELPKRRITDADFQEWSRYQLLAYLDLMQWAYVNDIEISQNCLGLALFPDEFEVGLSERIRKVVGPMARKVCRENFADMLREQALEAEPEPSESIPGKWRCVFLTEEGEFTFTPDPSRPLRFLF